MNNFDIIVEIIGEYLTHFEADIDKVSNLHEASYNSCSPNLLSYVYNGETDLNIVNMDWIAQKGYKKVKGAVGKDNIINTADAFIIDCNNNWFFLEFKDSDISGGNSGVKNSVLKKAYSNLYMLLDILFYMKRYEKKYPGFTYEQPLEFIKQHVTYILVCSINKNALIYSKINDCRLEGKKYTPDFMQKLKAYLFKDAFVYTEDDLEQLFVKSFEY